MAENDQTRWVGVRPVNPDEPLSVITKKLTPAISDLQAIEDVISYYFYDVSGAAGVVVKDTPVVPPGKLWVLTQGTMWNDSGALTLAEIYIKHADYEMRIQSLKAPAERVATTILCFIVMRPGEYVRFRFCGVPANDHNLVCTMRAYQVSQYT